MLNSYQPVFSNTFYNPNTNTYTYSTTKGESTTDFALGFGIGAKWMTTKGIIFEINFGIGRNLLNNESKLYNNEIVGRGGLVVGYRF